MLDELLLLNRVEHKPCSIPPVTLVVSRVCRQEERLVARLDTKNPPYSLLQGAIAKNSRIVADEQSQEPNGFPMEPPIASPTPQCQTDKSPGENTTPTEGGVKSGEQLVSIIV